MYELLLCPPVCFVHRKHLISICCVRGKRRLLIIIWMDIEPGSVVLSPCCMDDLSFHTVSLRTLRRLRPKEGGSERLEVFCDPCDS